MAGQLSCFSQQERKSQRLIHRFFIFSPRKEPDAINAYHIFFIDILHNVMSKIVFYIFQTLYKY